jgi:hypothetical protein
VSNAAARDAMTDGVRRDRLMRLMLASWESG